MREEETKTNSRSFSSESTQVLSKDNLCFNVSVRVSYRSLVHCLALIVGTLSLRAIEAVLRSILRLFLVISLSSTNFHQTSGIRLTDCRTRTAYGSSDIKTTIPHLWMVTNKQGYKASGEGQDPFVRTRLKGRTLLWTLLIWNLRKNGRWLKEEWALTRL